MPIAIPFAKPKSPRRVSRFAVASPWLVVIVASGALVLAAGCKRAEPAKANKGAAAEIGELTAQTLVVQSVAWPREVRVQGSLFADEVSAVGARVAGTIREVHVQLGDAVTAGQPLVTLDTAEFELMVAQAEAQLAQARAAVGIDKAEDDSRLNPENSPPVRQQRAVWDEAKASLERSRRLLDQAAISPGEFGVIEAAERVAAAGYAAAINSAEEKISMIGIRRVELDLAKQKLQDAVIVAPFDGLVQGRLVAPGGFIAAGDSVVTLVRTDPIWFRGLLPERYASKLKVGQSLRFRTESIDEPIAAVVTRISPSLEFSSRALAFEARVDNPEQRFRSGVFATAELVIEPEASAVAIPATAVSQFAGAEKVWKLVEGVAREAEIVSGSRRDGMVEITQGLVVGDVILADASIGKVAKILTPKSATAAAPEAALAPATTATPTGTPATTAAPAGGIGALVEKQGN